MADVKISALPPASTPLDGTEILPIVQGGITEQVSVANLTAGRTVAAATVNVDANSASPAVRITQTGAGNALLVEDTTSPDSTPFVIDANGIVISNTTASITTQTGAAQFQAATKIPLYSGMVGGATATNAATIDLARSRGTVTAPTIVSSGDNVGRVSYGGYDGVAYIELAKIEGAVDGTPGTNDMPGRLVFSTTADGASSPTERMRIDSAGGVSIGTSAATAGTTLRLSRNITGATTSSGTLINGVVQSDVTSEARLFATSASTAAAAFTLGGLTHFYAAQSTIGATSAVTNQYGFLANSNLTGATNNYGFYSNIASGTGRWNFYAVGTANNAYAGNSRFGGVTVPVATVDVTGSVAATTTILSTGATSGVGYATGAGGAVTQGTSRTTGVTLDKVSGAITLFSAAGSAAYQSFTVTNSAVAATDTIIVNQKSGTDKYIILVTAVAAGSFQITFATTGGTTTEQPVFNFAIVKAVAA